MNLRYLVIAAVLVCAMLGLAELADPYIAADQATSAEHAAAGLQSNDQVADIQQVTPVERACMVLVSNKAVVRERVGRSPLNVYRVTFAAAELDGYRDVQIKPKIYSNFGAIGFRGLGHEHFARADV